MANQTTDVTPAAGSEERPPSSPPKYNPWVEFVDTFFKSRSYWRFLRTYGHILASPTRNTLSLLEKKDGSAAFQFLGTSFFVYGLLILSKFISRGVLGSLLLTPLYIVIAISTTLGIAYALAHRGSPTQRSGHDFLILSSYVFGFTLPIAGVIQALQSAMLSFILDSDLTDTRLIIVYTLPLVVIIALYVYLVRVWKAFWGMSTGKVILHLVLMSIATSTIGLALAFSGLLTTPEALETPELTKAQTELAITTQLGTWSEQMYDVQNQLGERNFNGVNATIAAIGRSGRTIRTRFASVPDRIDHGERIHQLLIKAGDAAVDLAIIVQTNPPPFTVDPEQRDAIRLTSAISRFLQALNSANRAMQFPEVQLPS